MIDDIVSKIERQIEGSDRMTSERKETLRGLILDLKSELDALNEQQDDVHTIAGFAEIATREHLRPTDQPDIREYSTKGLRASIRKFEVTHPELTRTVQSITTFLSDLGI